eukprot:4980907-Pyramimonas_sp.AAC.1
MHPLDEAPPGEEPQPVPGAPGVEVPPPPHPDPSQGRPARKRITSKQRVEEPGIAMKKWYDVKPNFDLSKM